MKSPVTSITDDQLAELEEFVHVELFADDADAGLTMGEMRGLIARLRAAEADAKRFRLFIETVEAESAGATLTDQQKHLFHCMNSVSSVTVDQLIGFFDAAMERKA